MRFMKSLTGQNKSIGFIGTKRTVVLFACPWCGYDGDTFMHTDPDQPMGIKKCGDCKRLYISTYEFHEKDYDKFLIKLMEEL